MIVGFVGVLAIVGTTVGRRAAGGAGGGWRCALCVWRD